MQIILMLIVISLFIAGGFLLTFFWAVNDGQYEDDYTPALRLLIDDDMVDPTDQSLTMECKSSTTVDKINKA